MKKIAIMLVVAFSVYFVVMRPSTMPEAELVVFSDQQKSDAVKAVGGYCDDEKCLTIYVAPWCGACRRAHTMILSLVDQLEAEGVRADVVLGMDDTEALVEYAKTFPFSVTFDEKGQYFNQLSARGVPYFAATNEYGKVMNSRSGASNSVVQMRKVLDL